MTLRAILTTLFILPFCFTILLGQNVNVTFRVDMNAETISASGVHIAGNFQTVAGLGDNWNPGSTLVTDVNGDKIYEIIVSIPPGTYEYKFINGNAWGMDENPPAECSITNNHNREVTVSSTDLVLPAVPFNGCILKLRLAVNMTGQVISTEGVHVMGDFQQAAGLSQNWDPTSLSLQDLNRDGTYEVELTIPFGDYQYLFVNGNTTELAEFLPVECTVLGANGKQNRVLSFHSAQDNPGIYCFNSCSTCSPSAVYKIDTHWWNDAVFYEIFVRSFYDSNADGIGDFKGMMDKLDYLNDGNPETHNDLGITGIWLMPMMKSPSYHGYDAQDYYATEPDYGSMQDFENFLAAAHHRGIKVIIDLVMNHSSNQNPWFTQSAANTGGYRDWYVWSATNPGFSGPWGQTVWHPNGGKYYYGLFGSGLPDLNYRDTAVKNAMFDVVDFWLDKGVDGYRLDAIKYLVEDGNMLENTQETFDLLQELNTVYKTNNPDAFTVGEVWSSTASIIPYVQEDRIDACFEFGLAGAILDAVDNGNPVNLEEQLATVQVSYPLLQYGTFLTNHDMDRVFSALSSDMEKMKLAASIYLTLPGVPFIYYGEEVGMTGTGADPNKRRPMQWSGGIHAGFSTVTPWAAPGSNYQTNNVESMDPNPASLLHHYRQLIQIRNEYEVLRRGQTLMVEDNENDVFSFARILEDEAVLVVNNTSSLSLDPILSLDISALTAGEYFVTELLSRQSMGKITISADGGFTGWYSDSSSLSGRTAWILLLSVENTIVSTFAPIHDDKILLIPNPASESFQIVMDQNTNPGAQLQIFNSAGQLFFKGKMEGDEMTIQTNGWPDGIYFIQLADEKSIITRRVIIANR
jgi:glycosidase